ncbi:hypothetical protein VP1G_11206 [Cytospora mali]|uniref:Uncharacterized protein n=1 Tax=Cytospora mali TaxID=578113 RepID=A0A194V7L6_CYTMA|nr:hypothetical protein VP1G_11206 [Valsa mali var. pyri (nom. inval.)]
MAMLTQGEDDDSRAISNMITYAVSDFSPPRPLPHPKDLSNVMEVLEILMVCKVLKATYYHAEHLGKQRL